MAQITLNSTGVASSGSLVLQSNGTTTAVTVDASQNVGIGLTPSAWRSGGGNLEINAATNGYIAINNGGGGILQNAYRDASGFVYKNTGTASYFNIASDGNFAWNRAASGTAGSAITFTQSMILDASGNLLVGTTSAFNSTSITQISGNPPSNQVLSVRHTGAAPNGMYLVYTGATPNGGANYFILASDGTTRFLVASNGGIGNYSGNNVNLSDRREKTNFAPATSYLDKICAIPVQTFNYIDQNLEEDGGLTLGVVAQDVQAVAPELVMESNWANKDEEPKMRLSIYQTDLQYALMKCIQEQQALITQLQADVAALKA